jgi:hypothetical protein
MLRHCRSTDRTSLAHLARLCPVSLTATRAFQDLRSFIFSDHAVWRIREHNLDLPFGGEVPHTLEARTLQGRSAIAFIFEDPLFGYFQIVALGELDQRCRLACNGVLLALLLRGDPRVDRRHPHHRTPLHARARDAPEWAPKYRRLARAWTRAGDQTNRVKKTRKRHAVRKMKVGPSKSSCRRGLQTAVSCFSQKLRW